MSSEWRVHAQRITTGEWLTRDLPLKGSTTSRELSGPGGVFGVLNPAVLRETAADGRPLIEEWTTALYIEEAGQLRGGGIVNKVAYDKPIKTIEAPGFVAYPSGIPYMDNYRPDNFPDPIDLYRHLWDYVQSFPDGNLGVQVTGTDKTWFDLSNGTGPFIMSSFEYRDCGETMGTLAQAVPFDFLEQHAWGDAAHQTVSHEVKVGFPRLGRKRTDLRFAESENVEDWSPIGANGERFANDVYGVGQGGGSAMLTSRAAVRDGRLRRVAVIPLKAASQGVLDKETQRELRIRRLLLDVSEVTVKDHSNARIGSIQPGDDILVHLDVEWLGDVSMWLRVLAIEESGDAPGKAVLRTQRSDSFAYTAAVSPTGERQVLTL